MVDTYSAQEDDAGGVLPPPENPEPAPVANGPSRAPSGIGGWLEQATTADTPQDMTEAKLPRVVDQKSYDAVPAGRDYLDPDGNKRAKPYRATSASDYAGIPEGADYTDPQGNARKKPKFEPVSFTTQTLYDMALTDKERRKILESEYGKDRVMEDARGLFAIDEDGTYHKPGYGMTALGGGLTAAAGPVTGSVLGTIGGGGIGALSAPVTGPLGPFVGGTVGAVGGGMLGQYFNDLVLQLAGHYDRSPGEAAGNMALAGATSAMGAGVGRGIAAVVPTIKTGLSSAGAAAPAILRKILGASGEDLATAASIAEKGTSVPPSAVFKGAPHLQNVVERFDPAMDTSNPLKQSVERHYERGAGEILSDLGVPEFQSGARPAGEKAPSLLEPGSAPGTQRAGEALIARSLGESAQADADLAVTIATRRQAVLDGTGMEVAQREALTEAAERSRMAAQQLVDAGYANIEQTANNAMRVAQAGHNSGDLWEAVGTQLRAVRQGYMERARVMYQQADDLVPPGVVPDSRGLSATAHEFLAQLPEDFQRAYPNIVRQLERLGPQVDEAGEVVRPAIQPTFGELRNMRTVLRNNANWQTLSSDFRNGTYKFFAGQVDDALRNVEAVPALRPAVEQLNRADAFYRENMRVFDAAQIKTIMKGLEAGEPADPNVLYKAIIKEGHTDLINRIRNMVGPNLWSGVQGADLRIVLQHSRDLLLGTIDGNKFVNEILQRHRQGLLDVVHTPPVARQLLRQAEAVRAMTDARIPIQARPGDTFAEVILRTRQAAEEARVAARRDPLATLQREMRLVEREERRSAAAALDRKNDPLAFLYDPTTGASEATKKILGSEDLILATARRFGSTSPEFEMLRQVYAQQILQGAMQPSKRLAKVSEEVQQLMFPGVTGKQMETLAKEMDFLVNSKLFSGGDFGGALSATAKVEHPVGGKIVSGLLKFVPGVNLAGRSALGAYFAFARKMSAENPALFNYLLRGLSGTPEEKQAVRAILSKHAQIYAGYGAAGGEMLYQRGGERR